MARQPATPQAAQQRARQFLQALAKRAKLQARFHSAPGTGPVDEGNGMVYQPQAMADQANRTMVWDGTQAAGDPHYRDFVVAHELGHIAQPQLMPTRNQTDQYIDTAFGTKARAPHWIEGTPQGRAEVRMQGPNAILHKDALGMPWSGPGSLHSSAGEQYANDFAASLSGRRQGPNRHRNYKGSQISSAADPQILAKLRAIGLLPKSQAPKRFRDQG